MSARLRTATRDLARVMGCRARLVVRAPDHRVGPLLADATDQLAHLEARWSRFRPDSDISRLNRAGGRPVGVAPATVDLLVAMAAGVDRTGGAFDPTLLGSIVELGYGPSCGAAGGASIPPPSDRTAWLGSTEVDLDRGTVALPHGVHLDPGAIGKGLAADRVAVSLVERGATAAHVTVGGDLRAIGRAGVAISAGDAGRPVDHIAITSGGVATSGTGRRWTNSAGHQVHHVLDPRTGRPLRRDGDRDVLQVSVAADTATHAEVFATATLVDGPDRWFARLDALFVGAAVLRRDGTLDANHAWRDLRASGDGRAA